MSIMLVWYTKYAVWIVPFSLKAEAWIYFGMSCSLPLPELSFSLHSTNAALDGLPVS